MTAPIRNPQRLVDTARLFPIETKAFAVLKEMGPRPPRAISTVNLGAPWTGYASDADLLRLSALQRRIDIREAAARVDKAERSLIMAKCIKRMRRAKGKDQ
jgi:hypothetical protein